MILDNKQKLLFTAIIIIILAALGGILVWSEFQKAKITNDEARLAEERVVELKKDNAEQNIDTTDWKFYRNEKYGFEVRYPEKLTMIREYELSATGELVHYIDFDTDESHKVFLESPMSITFFEFNTDFEKYAKDNYPNADYVSIAGTRALKLETEYSALIKFEKRHMLFTIYLQPYFKSLDGDPISNEFLQDFDQILSTFRFIPSIGSGQVE